MLTEKDIKDDQPDILELFLPWTPTAGMQSGTPALLTQHIHILGDASLLFHPPNPKRSAWRYSLCSVLAASH